MTRQTLRLGMLIVPLTLAQPALAAWEIVYDLGVKGDETEYNINNSPLGGLADQDNRIGPGTMTLRFEGGDESGPGDGPVTLVGLEIESNFEISPSNSVMSFTELFLFTEKDRNARTGMLAGDTITWDLPFEAELLTLVEVTPGWVQGEALSWQTSQGDPGGGTLFQWDPETGTAWVTDPYGVPAVTDTVVLGDTAQGTVAQRRLLCDREDPDEDPPFPVDHPECWLRTTGTVTCMGNLCRLAGQPEYPELRIDNGANNADLRTFTFDGAGSLFSHFDGVEVRNANNPPEDADVDIIFHGTETSRQLVPEPALALAQLAALAGIVLVRRTRRTR